MGRPFEGRRWRLEVKLNDRERVMLEILRAELGETTDGGAVRRLLADAFDALPRRCRRQLAAEVVSDEPDDSIGRTVPGRRPMPR